MMIFYGSRWRQSRKKYLRDCRSEGVTFLRGVYHVRMRGVLRSFAYILKRRTSTTPNMPSEKKGEREREKKDEGKQKYLSLLLRQKEREKERREWMGKLETWKIKRRAENVEMYCVLKSFCPLSSRNVILFRRELTCRWLFYLKYTKFSTSRIISITTSVT